MTMYSPESQRNFMIQWFKSWSEIQKDDFVTVLAHKLSDGQGVNGIIEGLEKLDTSGRPPSLFTCQVKLFNEWWGAWAEPDREKMTELFKEADLKFWETVESEMKGTRNKLNEDFMVVTVPTPSEEDENNGNGGISINGARISPAPPVFKVTQIVTDDNNGVQVIPREENGNGLGDGDEKENLNPVQSDLNKDSDCGDIPYSPISMEEEPGIVQSELDISANATAV